MQGTLWDLYRVLKADGWVLDANGYTTSFRWAAAQRHRHSQATGLIHSKHYLVAMPRGHHGHACLSQCGQRHA